MFTPYITFIQKYASGKSVLVMLAIYVVYAAGVMGWGEKRIQELSGSKVQILDLCFTGYTPAEVNHHLNKYTPEAKTFAITFEAIADTIYPLVYTTLLTLLMAWVFKENMKANPKLAYLLLLPLLVMLFDFAENYHIIKMLQLHPVIPESLVNRGSFFTQGKWGLFGVIAIVIIAGLMRKFFRKPS